jgi:hypothetical protein
MEVHGTKTSSIGEQGEEERFRQENESLVGQKRSIARVPSGCVTAYTAGIGSANASSIVNSSPNAGAGC